MSNFAVPEAQSFLGALVRSKEPASPASPSSKGILIVMEYKATKHGEMVNFAGNQDEWFNLENFEIVSRKNGATSAAG